MRIVAPLTNVESYGPLVEAGADEFFCGIIPYRWLRRYQVTVPINRREYFLKQFQSNICGMGHVKILSRMVADRQVPVKVALNAHYYIPEAYPLIADLIGELTHLGFDTFIIADPALLVYLCDKDLKIKVHLSGELMVLSHQTLKFYDAFPVTRLVFPRKVDLQNVQVTIGKNPGLEYEAFVLNSLCPWSGGMCQSLHTDELPHMCDEVYRVARTGHHKRRFPDMDETMDAMEQIKTLQATHAASAALKVKRTYNLGTEGCGLCRIRELEDIGVTHLKVVGRGYALENLVNDVQNVKRSILLAAEERDKHRYAKRVQKELYDDDCPAKFGGCYYLDPPTQTGLPKAMP